MCTATPASQSGLCRNRYLVRKKSAISGLFGHPGPVSKFPNAGIGRPICLQSPRSCGIIPIFRRNKPETGVRLHCVAGLLERLRLDLCCGLHDHRKTMRPVGAAAGVDADLAGGLADQQPIAIVFDFMNPERSRRNLKGIGREAGLDKAGRRNYAGLVVPLHGGEYRRRQ